MDNKKQRELLQMEENGERSKESGIKRIRYVIYLYQSPMINAIITYRKHIPIKILKTVKDFEASLYSSAIASNIPCLYAQIFS